MNSLREQKIINSALWAAAGDAIGWISELTDKNGLKRRTDDIFLLKPVSWNRKIGGYSGVNVNLPAGTYSDDTQLRLAVSRAIRGNGEFDIESFAKIELPVWQSYSLGAGRATKWAAANLIRKDTNWFSNFYKNNGEEYVSAGGNGTAMRIQPHVWSCNNLPERKYDNSVIRDSIVTHGHLLSICGAIFHADCLQHALLNGKTATPDELFKIIDNFSLIPDVIYNNFELKNFWLPSWENISNKKLPNEIERIALESKEYLRNALDCSNAYKEPSEKYNAAIKTLECDIDSRRGTATNTAMASSLLCYFFRDSSPYEAIVSAVNYLGTDTDSIASMAGAILGCYSDIPKWDIQDSSYIINDAIRLNKISQGSEAENFIYPDLNKWQPPQTQSDYLILNVTGDYHILGLGKVTPLDNGTWKTKTHTWRWVKFDFGQSILVKSKADDIKTAETPPLRNIEAYSTNRVIAQKKNETSIAKNGQTSFDYDETEVKTLDIDEITSMLIKDGFNKQKIGHYLIELADKKGLESCIAYAAIISKAFITRKKR